MIYIDALQTLIQEEKNQIIELLEKVLKKVKFDEISPLDEISDNNLDDVRERKIMESLDLLQNENTLLKVDFEKVIEENKTLKKRNIELIDQIKNLLSTQDSRLKERTMNYEDIESQNRINESKLIDLQLKLDNKMKTQAKETSNLRVFYRLK